MRQTKLRLHYLKTQKYLAVNPNDLIARESLNRFIMSCMYASQTLYQEVTNEALSEDEQFYVNELFIVKKAKDRKYKMRDEDFEEDFEEMEYGRDQ